MIWHEIDKLALLFIPASITIFIGFNAYIYNLINYNNTNGIKNHNATKKILRHVRQTLKQKHIDNRNKPMVVNDFKCMHFADVIDKLVQVQKKYIFTSRKVAKTIIM